MIAYILEALGLCVVLAGVVALLGALENWQYHRVPFHRRPPRVKK